MGNFINLRQLQNIITFLKAHLYHFGGYNALQSSHCKSPRQIVSSLITCDITSPLKATVPLILLDRDAQLSNQLV